MRKLLVIAFVLFGLVGCTKSEPDQYTGRKLDFELFKASEYDFTGRLEVREMKTGALELTLKLSGPSSSSDYEYPAHLHFGSYDQADAPIAFMLNPVSSRTLASVTQLGRLSDGSQLEFEAMNLFDGHVKIHLANEGPDYGVILVAGNIGANPSSFNPEELAICGNSY